MRIISGEFKGRKLVKSDHLKDLRPTSDTNRENLFNILFSSKIIKGFGFSIIDAKILDICAGTGAISFEALSRGAKEAYLIEKNLEHIEIIKKNCQILNLEKKIKISNFDAKKLPQNKEFYNLIFIDPPYKDNYFNILKNLINKNWIQKNSLIILETQSKFNEIELNEFLKNNNIKILDIKKYSKTSFIFLSLLAENTNSYL